MADEMHAIWPLFQEKVQTIKSQFEYRCDIFYVYKVHTQYKTNTHLCMKNTNDER